MKTQGVRSNRAWGAEVRVMRALPAVLAVLVVMGAWGCGGSGKEAESQAPAAGTEAAAPATPGAEAPAAEEPGRPVDGRVAISVDQVGFHPARVLIPAGQSVVLAVTRVTEEGCGTEIVIPALKVRKDLPLHETVEVTIPAGAKGTEYAFACGMDMMKGTVVIE
jgi:plastocyanin